jgi:hypothetical protein
MGWDRAARGGAGLEVVLVAVAVEEWEAGLEAGLVAVMVERAALVAQLEVEEREAAKQARTTRRPSWHPRRS